MSKPILILGAGGFIGTQLISTLADMGEEVIAVSRRPIDVNRPNIEVIVGEPNEPEHFLPLVKRSRVVIHTASRSTPGSSAGHAIAELKNNLHPTLALLQALQEHPRTKLIYLSSGGSLYNTDYDKLASEDDIVDPRSYHGAGKIAAEHFIGAWCSQYGGGAVVLRPSNVYGPGQHERAGFGIVPAGLGKIVRKELLPVWGDGSAIRDYLYVGDFVTLCTAIIAKPYHPGVCLLNAASGTGVSLNELFGVLESVTGQPLSRVYDLQRSIDSPRVIMDTARTKAYCGWTATTSLHGGVESTWAWFNTLPR